MSMFFILVGLLAIGTTALALSQRPDTVLAADASLSRQIVDLTNRERSSRNLPALSQNDKLTKAAELKARDMFAQGYFSHTSPEGLAPWHWIEKAKYRYIYAGENLAIDYTEPVVVMQAWMQSPTHAENILTQQYSEIGIAVLKGMMKGQETTIVVQLFGAPEKS